MNQSQREKVMRQIEALHADGVEQYHGSLKGMPAAQITAMQREGKLTAMSAGIEPGEIEEHRQAQRQQEADQAKTEMEAAQQRYYQAANKAAGTPGW